MRKLNLKFLFVTGFFVLLSTGSLFASDGSDIDSGATAWMLTSTALVLLMVPGLAMFYGGLVRTKNVLGTMMHSFAAMGIMTVLWVLVGYSMTFGSNVLWGWFGWNSAYLLLDGIDTSRIARISPKSFALISFGIGRSRLIRSGVPIN